jgi:alpha-1,3-rhamnosyltransferase
MNLEPIVSILVPSFNHGKYLSHCIESILNQSIKNFEIVIVDDGSTDDSLLIAQSFEKRYPKAIRVFTHANHGNLGVSRTINRSIELSRGDFVCFLASDDWLPPDSLELRLSKINENTELGWVHGIVTGYNELSGVYGECGHHDLSQDQAPFMTLAHRNPISGMSVLMKRSLILEIGLFDPTLIYSDWDFWARALVKSKVAYCHKSTAFYRFHNFNTSLNIPLMRSAGNELAVLNKFCDYFPNCSTTFSSPSILQRVYFEAGMRNYFLHNLEACKEKWSFMLKIDQADKLNIATLKPWILPHLKTIIGLDENALCEFAVNFCNVLGYPRWHNSFYKWANSSYLRMKDIQTIKASYQSGAFRRARALTFHSLRRDPSAVFDPNWLKVAFHGVFSETLNRPSSKYNS